MYDVIIIGGGVTGAAIARELSRYKLQITLLEKEEELAFGVSKSNSGIVHPGTQNPPDSLKGKLCVEGNHLMRKLAKEIGVDFKEVGELIVAFDKEDIPRLKQLKKEAEQLGVRKLKIVDQKWLRKHEPNLSPDIVAALYAPTAGIISPYRLTYDLSENAKLNGVDIFINTKVEKIDLYRDPTTDIKKFMFLVETTNGDYETRYLINAAGLQADEISNLVGLDYFKITPRKGEEYLLDNKRENITNHLIFPLPSATSKGTLMIKTSDGNPMIGPTANDVESKDDRSTSDEGFQKVVASVKHMVPSVNERDIIAYFAGLRPVSGKDFIIKHEEKVPGFVNVAGIQSPGLTAAPAIAVMVANILNENGLELHKKEHFQYYRKPTTHLFAVDWKKAKELVKKDPAYGDIVCRCEMVSRKEIEDAIDRGARTLDGIKLRTRAQAGRCHGGFCTTRIMRILAEKTGKSLTEITKRGKGSEIVVKER